MRKTFKTKICRMIPITVLALVLICGIGSLSVFAASSVTGAINGYTTKGSSAISASSAGASTSYQSSGDVTVTSTYSYVNLKTLTVGSISKSNGYYSSCSVGFTAPSGCRSVKIVSDHKVSAYGQTWTTKTEGIY